MIFRWFYCNIKARFVKRSLFEKAANASPIRNIRRFAFASAALSNARQSPFFAQAYRPCHGFRGSTPWLNAEAALRSPPNLRQRVECGTGTAGLSGLSSRCGGVGGGRCTSLQKASTPQSPHIRAQNPGTRKDPPGSDLWPVRSGSISMLSACSIVQTRAAPKRRGVGLQRAKRRGSRHCRPKPGRTERPAEL